MIAEAVEHMGDAAHGVAAVGRVEGVQRPARRVSLMAVVDEPGGAGAAEAVVVMAHELALRSCAAQGIAAKVTDAIAVAETNPVVASGCTCLSRALARWGRDRLVRHSRQCGTTRFGSSARAPVVPGAMVA